MEGRQRRSFTDDYKRQAVDLVASSGRSIGSVAKELGLFKPPLQFFAVVALGHRRHSSNMRQGSAQNGFMGLCRFANAAIFRSSCQSSTS
jgi:transposase-like protein